MVRQLGCTTTFGPPMRRQSGVVLWPSDSSSRTSASTCSISRVRRETREARVRMAEGEVKEPVMWAAWAAICLAGELAASRVRTRMLSRLAASVSMRPGVFVSVLRVIC